MYTSNIHHLLLWGWEKIFKANSKLSPRLSNNSCVNENPGMNTFTDHSLLMPWQHFCKM